MYAGGGGWTSKNVLRGDRSSPAAENSPSSRLGVLEPRLSEIQSTNFKSIAMTNKPKTAACPGAEETVMGDRLTNAVHDDQWASPCRDVNPVAWGKRRFKHEGGVRGREMGTCGYVVEAFYPLSASPPPSTARCTGRIT